MKQQLNCTLWDKRATNSMLIAGSVVRKSSSNWAQMYPLKDRGNIKWAIEWGRAEIQWFSTLHIITRLHSCFHPPLCSSHVWKKGKKKKKNHRWVELRTLKRGDFLINWFLEYSRFDDETLFSNLNFGSRQLSEAMILILKWAPRAPSRVFPFISWFLYKWELVAGIERATRQSDKLWFHSQKLTQMPLDKSPAPTRTNFWHKITIKC